MKYRVRLWDDAAIFIIDAKNKKEALEKAYFEFDQLDQAELQAQESVEVFDGRNIYIARYTIHDGEHEYNGALLIRAKTEEEALEIGRAEEHEAVFEEKDERGYWDYGDGETRSELDGVEEISLETAQQLDKLGVAYFLN